MWKQDQLTEEAVPENEAPSVTKKKMRSWLTTRGYALLKSECSEAELKRWRSDLTVRPFVNSDYGPPPPSFRVYLESSRKLYLPKHYAYKEIGEPEVVKQGEGEAISIQFAGTIRPKQEPVVKAFLESCRTDEPYRKASRGGIISVPCGFGKTVLALYLAAQLGRKTLVIVHKEFLVTQWRERIAQYLPTAKVGCIQGNRFEVEGCDIVLGMLQSLSMRDYADDQFDPFGLCIVDECHHIAAEVFSRSLPRVNSAYMLGLSATPQRKDGLSKVFQWFLGPFVYVDKSKRESRKVEARIVHYSNGDPCYCREELSMYGKLCVPKMLNNVCRFGRRVDFLVGMLRRVAEDPNRRMLVLSDRIQHLKDLNKRLQEEGFTDTGYYIGGMTEKGRKESEGKQIILGTFSMSSEGMDIPTLNTLFLASSKTDIEQSVGRILRRDHGDLVPCVYDIVDDFSVFRNQAAKRKKFYQKKGYQISAVEARDGNTLDMKVLVDRVFQKGVVASIDTTGKTGKTNKTNKTKVCLIEETDSEEDE